MKSIAIISFLLVLGGHGYGQTNDSNSWSNRYYDSTFVIENNLSYSPPPKNLKKYHKKPQVVPSAIDTNAIYLFHSAGNTYSFIRFFSNNICFISEKYNIPPDVREYDQLDYGRFCTYKYENKNEEFSLMIEHFSNLQAPASYVYRHFKAGDSTIIQTKVKTVEGPNMGTLKMNSIAEKIPTIFKTYTTPEQDMTKENWELYLKLTAKGNNTCIIDRNGDTIWEIGKVFREWGYWRFTNQEDADFHIVIATTTHVNALAVYAFLASGNKILLNPIKTKGEYRIVNPKTGKVLKYIPLKGFKYIKEVILDDHSKGEK